MPHKRTATYTVDPKKLEKAYSEVKLRLLRLFGSDYEDDPNVEFELIDRQRQKRMQYHPVPYDHLNPDGSEPKNVEERIRALEAAMEVAKFNVDVAHREFDTMFSIWQHHKMVLAGRIK